MPTYITAKLKQQELHCAAGEEQPWRAWKSLTTLFKMPANRIPCSLFPLQSLPQNFLFHSPPVILYNLIWSLCIYSHLYICVSSEGEGFVHGRTCLRIEFLQSTILSYDLLHWSFCVFLYIWIENHCLNITECTLIIMSFTLHGFILILKNCVFRICSMF